MWPERFQYDVVGHLHAKQDGSGAVPAYEYDNLGRLLRVKYGYGGSNWPASVSYPLSTPDVAYTYYGGSRLKVSKENSAGSINMFRYSG